MNAYGGNFLSGSNKTRVPVENLALGMYVCELDKPWRDSPFLFQGFLLENESLLAQVKRECDYVYIDTFKQKNIFSTQISQETPVQNAPPKKNRRLPNKQGKLQKSATGANSGFNKLKDIVDYKISAEEISPPKKIKTFEEEINSAQQIHVRTCHAIKRFLHDAHSNKPINSRVVTNAVYGCMRSILRSPDAMLLMTHLRCKDELTWHHSINVCILAISLGRHLNLRYDELMILGLCGMLHDIGKMRIPLEILKKPGVYTSVEREIMRSHTTLGYKILSATPNIAAIVAEVAHTHHERLDGKGYPKKLSGDQISPFAKIIAIVDQYDTILTERSHKPGKTHLEAIGSLIESSGSAIDETLLNHFIQCIGVYPAGSIIETQSGEIGMVIEVNQKRKLRPKIMLLLDKKKKTKKHQVIDLADPRHDSASSPYTIKTIIRPDKYTTNVTKYYTYGAIQKSIAA